MDQVGNWMPGLISLFSTALSSGWVGIVALAVVAVLGIGSYFVIKYIYAKVKIDAANAETERKRKEAVEAALEKNRQQERDALEAIKKTEQMAEEARRRLRGGG